MILRERENQESVKKGVVFVFVCGNEVLLQKRNKNYSDDFSDCLMIPGGSIEFGETACNALVREVKEEINYEINEEHPAELLGCVDYEFKGKREAHAFLVRLNDKNEVDLDRDESGGMFWEDFDKAYKNVTLSATRDILTLARGKLSS